jgi:large subunit ribosomal protein L17
MRHRIAGKKLGRNPSHRLALYRNLALALFRHERIVTTLEKAKAVRPFVEKLITLAKKGTLHARRLAMAKLGPMHNAEVKPGDEDDSDHRKILKKLFDEIGPRFKDRPGGYTRVIKRSQRRLGDGGRTAFLELLKEGETKHRAKQPSPAPRVEEEEETPEEQEATGETGQEAGGETEQTAEGQGEQGGAPKP